jgi:hypothetical protein
MEVSGCTQLVNAQDRLLGYYYYYYYFIFRGPLQPGENVPAHPQVRPLCVHRKSHHQSHCGLLLVYVLSKHLLSE